MENNRKHWITPQEAAKSLDISRATVYRLCHDNKLRYYRIGKLFRIDPAFLTLWMESVTNFEQAS